MYRVLKNNGIFHTTHVNRWATDFYYIFYKLKKLIKSFKGQKYFNCYFTTPTNENLLAKSSGFQKVSSVGRMIATIRIAYKFGALGGRIYSKFLELFNRKQYFKGWFKKFAAHLIIRAYKI